MKAKNQLPKLGATAEGFAHPERTQKLTPPAMSHVKPRKKQKGKKP